MARWIRSVLPAVTVAALTFPGSVPVKKVHLLQEPQLAPVPQHDAWEWAGGGLAKARFTEDDQDDQTCRIRPFADVLTSWATFEAQSADANTVAAEAQEWVVKRTTQEKAEAMAADMRGNSAECVLHGSSKILVDQRVYAHVKGARVPTQCDQECGLTVRRFSFPGTAYAEYYAVGIDGPFVMQLHLSIPKADEDSFKEFAALAKKALAQLR